VSLALLALMAISPLQAEEKAQFVPRALLIEDARQLLDTIEEAHPDPHLAGGGRVAFHRRFHQMLDSIPAEGLPTEEFIRLLQPLIASIGDSHTGIRMKSGDLNPLFLPLTLRIVEHDLVVEQVADPKLEPLLGARLVSIEGVSMQELLNRQGAIRGMENRYGHLVLFNLRTLATHQGLQQLIPEWQGNNTIRVEVIQRTGDALTTELRLPDEPPDAWKTIPSRVDMPSTESSDVAYAFLDVDRSTALLVVSNLMRYREACELWLAEGLAQAETMTTAAYEHFHGTPAPDDRELLLAGIPSATETIADLVRQMAAAGTRDLIVDLRGNTGGNSALREILVYLLYGDAAMLSLDNGYQIVKLSRLLFEQYDTFSLEQANEGQPFPLGPSDYDFREETSYRQPHLADEAPEETFLAAAPSFWDLYQTKEFHEPKWKLHRVLVLSSPSTFSSGFNVLTGLYAMGAIVVGTPSAQPGNNFGDVLQFQLRNTGLEGFVSHKQNITFPDDPEKGRCLQPHHPLTLEKLASYDFDPNAEILMALEILGAEF
jgi:hypothetical protein